MDETQGKTPTILRIGVLIGLHRLGGSGRLRDVGGWLKGRGMVVGNGPLHTTLTRLKEAGELRREDSTGVAVYHIEDIAYERMRQWGVSAEWMVEEVAAILKEVEAPNLFG